MEVLALLFFLGLPIAFVAWPISVYNNLVSVANKIEEARDNLRALIVRIDAIREQSLDSVDVTSTEELKFQSDIAMAKSGSLTGPGLIAVAEAFPVSVSTNIRQDLITEFNRLELEIHAAVKRYNHFVNAFNTLTEVFPNNVFISIFFNKFTKADYISRNQLDR
jgi:hypothetical protein